MQVLFKVSTLLEMTKDTDFHLPYRSMTLPRVLEWFQFNVVHVPAGDCWPVVVRIVDVRYVQRQ